jgi:hypothetical protein
MRTIALASGEECLVDDEDFELLSWYSWSRHSAGYAVAYDRAARDKVLMHRLIADAAPGQVVDHRNHNKLDNRKHNLSVATQSENMLNRAKLKNARATGRFRGVHPHRPGAWIVMYRGKYLGVFMGEDAEERGARAYDAAAIAHRGMLAQTNFVQEW